MPPRTKQTTDPEQPSTAADAALAASRPPWWDGRDTPPTVHECIARAMGSVPAVGKWGTNTHDRYGFKRIDDFMTAANAALSEAGVHITFRILQRLVDDSHQTSGGNVMRWVDMEVEFTFHGPTGDHVQFTAWGEARDASDKATNKALTAAMKYVLMYGLMIPTEDMVDADRDSHEARPVHPTAAAQQQTEAQAAAERQAREAAEQQARDKARADMIARTDADPDVVAELRRTIIRAVDSLPPGAPRFTIVDNAWREAGRLGGLGCTVPLPEAWHATVNLTECTLHELVTGVRETVMPPSGESTAAEQQEQRDDLQTDPWAGDQQDGGA